MARVEDLISKIADGALRSELAAAVAELKRRVPFGLVFEEHIPEMAALVGLPAVPGSIVTIRHHESARLFRVEALRGKSAKLRDLDDHTESEALISDLLVLKRMGEPMFPALQQRDSLRKGPSDAPSHVVIDGENFHALQLMLFGLRGSVDCIYIDPPYNVGGDGAWKYNNRFVDDNDTWRHSKWLSFMEKRLRLAKQLLKPDGVLIITIDEHELHHLGMLLERPHLFAEYNRYLVSIVINSRGSTGKSGNFGVIEEHALFVVPDGHDLVEARELYFDHLRPQSSAHPLLADVVRAVPDIVERLEAAGVDLTGADLAALGVEATDDVDDDEDDDEEQEDEAGSTPVDSNGYWRGAQRTGQATSFRHQRERQFYPIFIDPKKHVPVRAGEVLGRDADGNFLEPDFDSVEGLVPVWPIDQEGEHRVWCWEPGRMNRAIAAGHVKVGRYNRQRGTYPINAYRVRRTKERFRERTIWWHPSYDAGSNGTLVLKAFLGRSGAFPFPKSVYAVRDTLATVVGRRTDAVILDFFGGSGTTLHATLLLNAMDEGTRRCIVVTNNEVDQKTAQRLAKEGHFPGDAEFEAHGIFESVTLPRAKAVVSGRRPDGLPVRGKHSWAANRPYAEGFEANVEFFALEYLDRDDVELGLDLPRLLPTLWLASGAIGPVPHSVEGEHWVMPPDCPFAVLLRASRFRRFAAELEKRTDVTHVWLVTESEEALAEMTEALPAHLQVGRLYADYLERFRPELIA
ncbi:MAG TPA: DNA methyltransferase [Acidimicrobiales bacterium]|jgi:adenine-specific DNA-methyltransferase|nr:DNA methyltransferase [Acidimicrobiales bacterium]